MASEVLCGDCGTLLANPAAPCPRCGAASAPLYAGIPRTARKSPWLAALLAVFPGLGHLYLGQPWKGAGYLIGVGLLQFLGLDLDLTVIGLAFGVPIELGGGTLWAYSVVDAYRTARRMEASAGA